MFVEGKNIITPVFNCILEVEKKVSMQLQIRSLTQGFFAPLKRSTKRELRQSLLLCFAT